LTLLRLVVQLLVLGLAALPRGQLDAEPDERNLVVVNRVGRQGLRHTFLEEGGSALSGDGAGAGARFKQVLGAIFSGR